MNVIDLPGLTPKKLICPMKRDHFERKFHLPTINVQGLFVLLGGVIYFHYIESLLAYLQTHPSVKQLQLCRNILQSASTPGLSTKLAR